jgi:hypothetical protein
VNKFKNEGIDGIPATRCPWQDVRYPAEAAVVHIAEVDSKTTHYERAPIWNNAKHKTYHMSQLSLQIKILKKLFCILLKLILQQTQYERRRCRILIAVTYHLIRLAFRNKDGKLFCVLLKLILRKKTV